MTHSAFPPAFVYLFLGGHNQDILTYSIFFTQRVAVPSSQPRAAVGSISIHRISALLEYVDVLLFEQAA